MERSDNPGDKTWESHRGIGAGIFFAVGGILVLLATTTAEEVVPGFSVKYQAISTLGGSGYPTMLYWDSQILLAGILWIIGTRLLYRSSKFSLSSINFYPVGIGLILVSLNPWNINPFLHMIGAVCVAFFGATAAILSSRLTGGYIKYTSVFLGILSLFALFGTAMTASVLGPGGAERLIYYPIFFWAILFGGVLIGRTPLPASANLKS
ncbi:MAG: DUF998 domain-containing protein [Candidatus Thermoplasmatota archaeon]|nr:DUF998 domain-containing protein [Candidatus Thermoplasmatota archaeon]MDA8143850.1 DUF998 domain-containing protein [Thermoplasmatales archaeon]